MSEYPWNEAYVTFTWFSSLYNSFKAARDEASSTLSVAIIQTDWSENAKMY